MDSNQAPIMDNLKQLLWQQSSNLYVMMPGRVEAYYPETQSADVQPLPKVIYPGMAYENMFDFPVIPNVQVQFPRTDATDDGGPKSIMYMPIKKGTTVMLVWANFSLDNWAVSENTGKTYDPQDMGRHDLSDAIAVPGIFPFSYKVAATDSSKGTGGPTVDPNDIRLVLEWPDRNIKSEVYLGGDTGDIVVFPQRNACLGDPNAANSPVPQKALKTWLQAILDAFTPLLDALNVDPGLNGGSQAAALALKTNLTSLMTRFDDEDPAGAQNSFGVMTKKVLIP